MMAKSLEDTAFYRYHRLLALNEVGGDPAAKALSVDAFHAMMQARAREWPHGMTATATHDTKRGEDARARIMALAEIPGEWTSAVARWKAAQRAASRHSTARCARRRRRSNTCCIRRCSAPGSRTTIRFVERMQAYALKAAREGKQETSWLNPHEAYEAGVKSFIAKILDPSLSGEFLNSLRNAGAAAVAAGRAEFAEPDHAEGDDAGRAGFLSGHGVLGFFAGRSRQPAAGRFCRARSACWRRWRSRIGIAWSQNWPNGHLKLAWTRHLLKLRTELADVFADGDYQPLEVSGPHRDHVIAFARRRGRDAAIVVVARWFAPFTDGGRHWPAPESFEPRSMSAAMPWKALPMPTPRNCGCPTCLRICRSPC